MAVSSTLGVTQECLPGGYEESINNMPYRVLVGGRDEPRDRGTVEALLNLHSFLKADELTFAEDQTGS